MSIPYKERVGEKFNMLKIIELTSKKGSGRSAKQLCIVECECGNKKEVAIDSVTSRGVKSCGCSKRIHGNSALSRTFGRYKSGARNRGYEFSLNREDFSLLTSQDCHYCGSKPETLAEYNGQTCLYNGIDRKDNSEGYTVINSLPCCMTCNRAKNNMPYDEFVSWIRRLKSHDIKND